MIRFAHPQYLHLLWIVPILLAGAFWEYRWRRSAMRSWAKEALWESALPERAPGRLLSKRLAWIGAVMFGALAMGGPQVGTRLIEATREGVDLVIALDVSKSMLAEDIAPNRLLKAKHEIVKFLGRLKGDRVALVPFAGAAFVQVPLTLDYGAFGALLNALEPGIIPRGGTELSEAIEQGARAFRAESKASKVMILITDGEDHEPGAVAAAKKAAENGVIIYTVGMASASGAPIPEKDGYGRITGYIRESGEGTVVSKLNEELLGDIASATGGEFYLDNSGGDEFRKIYERISGMDKQKFEQKTYADYEDRFQWPLAIAFLLLVADELILPYRRRKSDA